MSNYLPVIGITMGDATGVGPEIVVKSLTHESVYRQCRPLVIGDAAEVFSLVWTSAKGGWKAKSCTKFSYWPLV